MFNVYYEFEGYMPISSGDANDNFDANAIEAEVVIGQLQITIILLSPVRRSL